MNWIESKNHFSIQKTSKSFLKKLVSNLCEDIVNNTFSRTYWEFRAYYSKLLRFRLKYFFGMFIWCSHFPFKMVRNLINLRCKIKRCLKPKKFKNYGDGCSRIGYRDRLDKILLRQLYRCSLSTMLGPPDNEP